MHMTAAHFSFNTFSFSVFVNPFFLSAFFFQLAPSTSSNLDGNAEFEPEDSNVKTTLLDYGKGWYPMSEVIKETLRDHWHGFWLSYRPVFILASSDVKMAPVPPLGGAQDTIMASISHANTAPSSLQVNTGQWIGQLAKL